MTFENTLGFFLGFFLGCCGLLIALLLRGDYLRGALVGVVTQISLSVVAGSVTALPMESAPPIPWELVGAFVVVVMLVVALTVGAIWAFGGRDDDGDEPPTHRPDLYRR